MLGVRPDASPAEVTTAFRALAKRWHPDRRPAGADGPDRMALVNAAYAALRADAEARISGRAPAAGVADGPAGDAESGIGTDGRRATGRAGAHADLAPAVARAMGAELRSALEPGEVVTIVVPAATWASPQATLAVTDRRLLWLLDDAPVHRVRDLPFADVRRVRVREPRRWRRRAVLACVDRRGRRVGFGDLASATARAVERHVRLGANLE